ncbi:Hsp33 family molecular chaperone HslO [Weissella koreensis]|uniref:Hsp33 family molecular chaperone HslO n=1 Tax=Weissella koreensis TaxID=165096 RepID=A0A7H1MM47_9LACO|nr:Hsp33 family molecular chaperone HslO [Weissella koreensis]AEJ23707.1 disulfide bond chaperones of the HSP33 family protein [Weissella koreensis KACC 15510]AVH75329.1 molecular chaperone Hsp33 [Weissella koreensis]EJF34828.1 heat shock protein Hsp33 [Weissella koreensis KCTC 3621]MCZ9311177.1 Hsp33 family molecular chaperone HslO [Weissella koreensis]QGN20555.1 redox-regulated molecular chaperone Hsp33 [Weissella koreensis]
MADTIVRAITKDNNFRTIAIDGTEMLQQAASFHQATPMGINLLGRALLSTLLVSNAILKGDERLAVTIEGNGPAGKIVTESSATGLVRGYVTNPQVQTADIVSAVGTEGFLRVTKEMDGESQPFTGSVALASGRIDDDFTYYMLTSEQIPSLVMVDVAVDENKQVHAAGGFIVSALPDAKQEALDRFYQAVENMPEINQTLQKGQGTFGILERIFGNDNLKQLSTEEVSLYPDLTKREYARMLATLNNDQLQEMVEDDQGAEIVDRFTGNKIQFNTEELQNIMDQK